MEPVVLAANETVRLQVLANLHLLDTPSEERYDRLTRLAAAHFGQPYAAINLVDADRHWSKSCVGDLSRELPRKLSFCAYTVARDEPVVIEDLSADPRFADHPLVQGPPQLRFYAAVPVHSASGQPIGTLCVIGEAPVAFGAVQRRELQDFGYLVEREISTSEVAEALRETERSQARFRAAAEANLDAFLILESVRDGHGRIVDFIFSYANSRAEQIIDLPRAQILGQRLCELLPINRSDGFFDKYVRVVESGAPLEEEFTIEVPNHATQWLHHQVVPLGDGVAITSRNVTARRIAEEASAQTTAQLQEAVHNLERRTRDIMLLNELGELLLSSRTIDEVGDVVALSLRTLLPRTMGVLYLEQAAKAPLAEAASWGGYQSGPPLERDACWALRRQRVHYVSTGRKELFCRHSITEQRCESLCIPLRSQGRLLGLLHVLSMRIEGVISTLDEAHRQLAMTVAEWTSLALANLMLQRELRQQALHDPLTGLYNRRYFEDLMPKVLADSARNGQPVSVISVDIDHFKQVNDRYGHAVGDQVLQAMAFLLRGSAGSEAFACRFGGEEFVLVLPQTAVTVAATLAEELRQRAATLHLGSVIGLPQITASFGVAAFPQHGDAIEQLLVAADAALYRAKSGGRNRVELAEPRLTYDGLNTLRQA